MDGDVVVKNAEPSPRGVPRGLPPARSRCPPRSKGVDGGSSRSCPRRVTPTPCLNDDLARFEVVNPKDSAAARCFTLLHELAHLWVDEPRISGGDPMNPVEGWRPGFCSGRRSRDPLQLAAPTDSTPDYRTETHRLSRPVPTPPRDLHALRHQAKVRENETERFQALLPRSGQPGWRAAFHGRAGHEEG